jgi:hypothetical protein
VGAEDISFANPATRVANSILFCGLNTNIKYKCVLDWRILAKYPDLGTRRERKEEGEREGSFLVFQFN